MAERGDAAQSRAEQAHGWAGHRLDEVDGRRVGRVVGALADRSGGEPRWLVARMGRFGHFTLVPARDAVEGAACVWVPYTREQIRGAPRFEPDAPPDAETERQLAEHYGLASGDGVARGPEPS
jgi:hypothetical protein